MNVIERGKPKTASLRRLAHVSYSPTLVRCCVFILYFGFCLAESLLPVEPLGPPSNETGRGGKWWGVCFNVILLKTFTNKKFSVHIAAEDFSQHLFNSNRLNRWLDFTTPWLH